MAYTDGNIIIGTSVDMYGMNTGLKKIEKSAKKLQYSLGAALGIGLFSFGAIGKAALDAASDLQEVQNIVDVAFGDMADMANDFANIAIEKFGMSELSAKQTAGSFMAMGKALGIAEEDAAKMAIRLTALTGDMASFYNISQDYARVALSAVYTGETETLKRYGIVLTEANLQEYASTLGIETKVKAMDASSKAMLRYNYILQQTTMLEGDFVRTQNSWANQTRILQQRWKQLLITMGNGLVTILSPAIRALNIFMQKLINFANTIGAIIGKLFHIQWQDISVGADSAGASLGDLGDFAEDAADGLDDVGNSAKSSSKKVKNTLAPFDDLQVLMQRTADNADDADDALSGLSIPDLDLSDYGSGSSVSGGWGDWLIPDINDLFELGRWLSDKLLEMLQNIDWDSIYEGARRFGRGLADFLNGLITPELFYELGRTLANALNTAIYAALEFGKYFDWINLGNSIAAAINGFFENFDFKALAQAINIWANGLLDMAIQAINKTNWDLIGKKIGEFLLKIDWLKILKKVVKLIVKAFEAAFKVMDKMFEVAPIETMLISFGLLIKFLTSSTFKKAIEAVQLFGTFLTALGTGAEATRAISELRNASPILAGFVDVIAAVQIAWEAAVGAFTASEGIIGGVFSGISTFLLSLHELIPPVVQVIGTIVTAIMEIIVLREQILDVFHALSDGSEDLALNVVELIAQFGLFTAALVVFAGPIGLAISAIAALTAGVIAFVDYVNEITMDAFNEAFQSMIESTEGAGHTLSDYKGIMLDVTDSVIRDADTMSEKLKSLENTRGSIDNLVLGIESIGLAMQSQTQLTSSEVETLQSNFSQMKDLLADAIAASYDYVITQTTLDLMYLKSTGELTEAQEKAYTDQLARLQEEKQAAIDNSGTIVESMDTNLTAYREAADAYAETQEKYKEGKATADEVKAAYDTMTEAYDTFHNTLNEGMGLLADAGLIEDDYSGKVNETKKSIDDLTGSLDLSNQKIDDVNGLSTQVVTALGDIQRSYDDGKQAIEDMSEAYVEEVEKMNISDSEREELLALHQQRVDENMAEIQKTYNESLTGIQQDLVTLIPEAVAKLGEQWDEGNIDGTFLGFTSKEDYIESQMNEFIQQLYNEQLTSELETALEKTQGDVEPTAQETSEKIIKNLTEVDTKAYWDYWGTVQGGNITAGTAIAVQEAQDPTFKNFTQFGEGSIISYDDGIRTPTAWDKVKKSVGDFAKGVYDWFHNSILNFGSPSKTFIEFGENTIQGYNDGIGNKSNESITSINKWADDIVNAFMAVDKFSQFIPMLDETIFIPLQESLTTSIEQINVLLDEWLLTLTTNYFGYDIWLQILNEGILLALTDFFTNQFIVGWDTFMQEWWTNHVLTWFKTSKWQTEIFTPMFTFIKLKWANLIKWWELSVKTWYDDLLKKWANLIKWWNTSIDNWWNDLKQKWQNLKEHYEKALKAFLDKLKETYGDITDATDETFSTVQDTITEKINAAKDAVVSACEEMLEAIQAVLEAMEDLENFGGSGSAGNNNPSSSGNNGNGSSGNGSSGRVNGFMPRLDIFHFEDNLGMSAFRFPELATGAVIPPNKPFMAMLGDQRNGTNIETPLNTMLEAFRSALSEYNLGNNNQNATMEVDGEAFARLMLPYIMNEMHRQGYNTDIIEGA